MYRKELIMKTTLKIISLILVLAYVLPAVLIACGNKDNGGEKEPVKEDEVLTILADGKSDYTLIRADEASEVVIKAAATLRNTFTEKFGAEPDIKSDWLKRGEELPVGTKEILIGQTNRPESEQAMNELEEGGFLIKVYGERIAIVAADDAMLVNAINYFINTYVASATDKVVIAKDLIYVGNASQYAPVVENADGTITLKLANFVVTYDSSNKQTFVPSVAKAFASRASELYGIVGATEDKSVNDYEILFGECDREDFKTTDKEFLFRDFYIGYSNNKISVSAFSIYGYERAINLLLGGFGDEGITIPAEGLYDEYDYNEGRSAEYAAIYKNYENPSLDNSWLVSVCHRGDVTTNKYPENSIPSYQSCLDNKVDVIETDLKKTKDGVWVICHDQTLKRTTTGSGTISSITYKQIQKYTLKTQNGGDGSTATSYKMPTLVEIIELCKGKCLFNLDHLDPSVFQEVYDVFEENDAVEMAMFKTSSWKASDLIAWFSQLIEDGRELPLFSPLLYSDTQNGCTSFKGLTTMVETGRGLSQKELTYITGSCNIRAMCLTALSPELENFETYTQLQNLGYGGIMTDAPVLLKEFVHGK